MIIVGVVLILIKYKILKVGFMSSGHETYKIAPPLEERLEQKKSQPRSHELRDKDEGETTAKKTR